MPAGLICVTTPPTTFWTDVPVVPLTRVDTDVADGIVTLTLDDPTGSANVMNEHYKESMHKAVERLVEEKDSITGVVIFFMLR